MTATPVRPEAVGGALLLTLGAVVVRLLLTEEYLRYVRPGMAPFLGLTAVLLVVLGGWTLAAAARTPQLRGHLPAMSWLLLWPVLIVLVVAPGTLGAFSARRAVAAPPPALDANGFLSLPAGDPVGLPLDDYVDRALYGGELTLQDRRLDVLGFVSPGRITGSWYVTRLQIRCCAADALPVRVLAVGAPAPPVDVWVSVSGRYLPATADRVARLQVETVAEVAEPRFPYVYG